MDTFSDTFMEFLQLTNLDLRIAQKRCKKNDYNNKKPFKIALISIKGQLTAMIVHSYKPFT